MIDQPAMALSRLWLLNSSDPIRENRPAADVPWKLSLRHGEDGCGHCCFDHAIFEVKYKKDAFNSFIADQRASALRRYRLRTPRWDQK